MVFLLLPLPVYSRHPSCPLGIAQACVRHVTPILVRLIHVPVNMAHRLQVPEWPLGHLLRVESPMPEESSRLQLRGSNNQ